MLGKLRIGSRLVLLISMQTILLVIVGIVAIVGLRFAANTTSTLNKNVIEQVKLNQLNETIRVDLLGTVNDVVNEKINFTEGRANLLAAKNLFINNWDEYSNEDRTAQEANEIEAAMAGDFDNLIVHLAVLDEIFIKQNYEELHIFIDEKLANLVNPFLVELNEKVNEHQLLSEQLFKISIQKNKDFLYNTSGIIGFGLLFASILGFLIFRSIVRPIRQISTTVSKVSAGDYYARTKLKSSDELGDLGSAFDSLLEDKVATLVQAEKDNEQLNESVINLLQAVSKLSKRDLTIKVPVTEDVTGPVADALNQFSSETSKVLQGVRRISEEVARASATVKSQSDNVISYAAEETVEIKQTTKSLVKAVSAMQHIADLAKLCNAAAENAITTTHTALDTVNSSIQGINGIRETIHETEKRIKRLGERSQEISRAVNLINSISERTHILALNASMHAASAGEAGRGFAVVADEVQRLAENARDATSQISTLVSNIQVETSDTVTTMNTVISQVVEGTHLAEQAGDQMKKTRDSTEHLVDSVREIAKSTQDQIELGNDLQKHAHQIEVSTTKTSEQLTEQTLHTKRLVEYARGLLKAVQVFKLPNTLEKTVEANVKGVEPVHLKNVVERKAS